MVSEERKEFANMRRRLLNKTGSKQFICARCGLASKSVNIHHIKELFEGGENKTKNMIPLCWDCHREWDLCHDIGMTFGEFLVSLPSKAWQTATYIGLFRYYGKLGGKLKNIYQIQFTGNALKYPGVDENPMIYYEEIERQNKIFSAYPYSDTNEMLRQYGTFYETFDNSVEFKEFSEEMISRVLSKGKSS